MTPPTTTTGDGPWTVHWKYRDYKEMKWMPGQEPRKRWLPVIVQLGRSKWHVTVAFEGSLHSDRVTRVGKEIRRQDLANLCLCLDFGRLQLLDDKVTELLIKRDNDTTPSPYQNDFAFPDNVLPLKSIPGPDSEYYPLHTELRLCLREDPYHVQFPTLDSSINIPMTSISEIRKTRELSAGVHEAQLTSGNKPLVFKEVDKPLYMPRDSQVLYQELQNLQLCQGLTGIVQLVAAVVSQNPYQTMQSDTTMTGTVGTKSSAVLRGILLEYHSNGTLEAALQNAKQSISQTTSPWQKWALQIAQALGYLHQRGITHMDLKPSNIIISAEHDAILTDISGIGGTTRAWLAPEMLYVSDPLSESIDSRVRNDIWALGKLLCEMAHSSCNRLERSRLSAIASVATRKDPSSRISLHDVISHLSQCSEPSH
ncbi:kinase-like domain-containing protein [Clohesyomyces aquaticus]|uniref:Kinase-like domain-containing protein n=1 Tax=Clohesyomyces aquaticus TaxID=1231657 RepID=A0A1Y1YBP7_9PLEO|nr:kinase-like domain-containing protein [Clohesyomyces aquaticus]